MATRTSSAWARYAWVAGILYVIALVAETVVGVLGGGLSQFFLQGFTLGGVIASFGVAVDGVRVRARRDLRPGEQCHHADAPERGRRVPDAVTGDRPEPAGHPPCGGLRRRRPMAADRPMTSGLSALRIRFAVG